VLQVASVVDAAHDFNGSMHVWQLVNELQTVTNGTADIERATCKQSAKTRCDVSDGEGCGAVEQEAHGASRIIMLHEEHYTVPEVALAAAKLGSICQQNTPGLGSSD
jgi:hypothetical protein